MPESHSEESKTLLTWSEYYLLAVSNFKAHGELRIDRNTDLYAWINEQRQRTFFFIEEIDRLIAIKFFDYRKLIESEENLRIKIESENWSLSEDQFLTEQIDLSIEKLANQLKRPTSSIRRRRQSLGIAAKKRF